MRTIQMESDQEYIGSSSRNIRPGMTPRKIHERSDNCESAQALLILGRHIKVKAWVIKPVQCNSARALIPLPLRNFCGHFIMATKPTAVYLRLWTFLENTYHTYFAVTSPFSTSRRDGRFLCTVSNFRTQLLSHSRVKAHMHIPS